MVGRRRKALYGTRDAPMAWREELLSSLQKWGFTRSLLLLALFTQPEKMFDVVVQVDDMLGCGQENDLECLRNTRRENL